MNGFYVSMIFLGILLVLVSLLFIALDKKKVFNFTKNLDEKKQQLAEILNDAEQMIEELNKFSDYIVNQMDIKNEELNKNLKIAEEKVVSLSESIRDLSGSAYVQPAVNPAADGSSVQPPVSAIQAQKHINRESAAHLQENVQIQKQPAADSFNVPEIPEESKSAEVLQNTAVERENPAETVPAAFRKKDKVIPLRNKYSEVLRLSQQGVDSIDIARGLNMGKGEVELIIGLRG